MKIIEHFDLNREYTLNIIMSPHTKLTLATETEELIDVTKY